MYLPHCRILAVCACPSDGGESLRLGIVVRGLVLLLLRVDVVGGA